MNYLTICSGIGAPEYAWRDLPWTCIGQAEIAPFPSAVLAARFPTVTNYGDFTTIEASHVGPVDLICGGTPCQSFSVAGKRLGLDDPRGNLAIEYLRLAKRLNTRWIIWENVAGVLSSNGERDFGAFVGLLAQCGFGFAYRILDAANFGVPQRRRRIFLVAHADWRCAAAVLFERESLCGHFETGAEAIAKSGGLLPTLTRRGAGSLREEQAYIVDGGRIRHMTAIEAERAQGFPDDWTAVEWRGKPGPNQLRQHAIGNSMATPVLTWIGQRIAFVDGIA